MPDQANETSAEELLAKWEDVYKKGLLTFWVLLLLHERPAYPYEMAGAIKAISQGTISADDNSLYRALNRFEGVGIVEAEFQPSNSGPPRKYYRLTAKGAWLLDQFIRRNTSIFQTPQVTERIQSVLGDEIQESEP